MDFLNLNLKMSSILLPLFIFYFLLSIVLSKDDIKIFCGRFDHFVGNKFRIMEQHVMVEVYDEIYFYERKGLQTMSAFFNQIPTKNWHETKMKAAFKLPIVHEIFESFKKSSDWRPEKYDRLLNNNVHFVFAFVRKIVGSNVGIAKFPDCFIHLAYSQWRDKKQMPESSQNRKN